MAQPHPRATGLLYASIATCIAIMTVYLTVRIFTLDITHFTLPGLVMAGWLLLAE